MAKSDLGMYMTPSAKGYLKAQRPRMITPTRSSKTIDPSSFSGKKAAAGAPLASRQVAASIQETGPEAMSITDGEASTQPQMVTETQQPIENRGDSARYMIQGGGPRIDLSFLVPERANKAYDPSKAIGGENVPYQESKGIGGFFRRLLGDESNRMNIEAQQAQGAEWREAEKETQKEERLLNRMREADKPTQARFEATQASGRESEANRVAAENKRLELEGKRVGLTEQQIAEARQERIDRLKGEQEDRAARIENMRNQNALADAAFGRSMLPNAQAISTGQGGVLMYDPRSGQPIGTFSSPTIGQITDPKTGEKTFGPTGGGYKAYTPPVKAPVNTGGAQVNRADGNTLGGPLPTTTTKPEAPNTALFPTMGRAIGESTTEATTAVTDPLRAVGTDIYKALFSSGAQQDPEVLKRIKEREARRANTQPRFNVPLGY